MTGGDVGAVLIVRENGVATVTLNRPEAMNALSLALRRDFSTAMRSLAADEEIRAIIVTGAGERAFTAGLDLKELGADAKALGSSTGSAVETGTAVDLDPVAAILACPQPVIGAINGVAITGGLEVALACDILIASSKARFADTHARVGIMPGWGLSQRLSRVVGLSRAKEMSLTGNFIDAATACAWSMVNRVVAPDELMVAATALARDIASADPTMVRGYKRLIDDGYAETFGEALALERRTSSKANALVEAGAIESRRQGVLTRGREKAG